MSPDRSQLPASARSLIFQGIFLLLNPGGVTTALTQKDFSLIGPICPVMVPATWSRAALRDLELMYSQRAYPDEHAEPDTHLELLGQQKLLPKTSTFRMAF